jgi:hypothetical protein
VPVPERRKSGDSVVVETALMAGEDGGVYLFFEVVSLFLSIDDPANVLAVQYHSAAGAAEGFVPRGRDDVGMGEGEGRTPAETRPEICAISLSRYAPTLSPISRIRSYWMRRLYAEVPAMNSFGR